MMIVIVNTPDITPEHPYYNDITIILSQQRGKLIGAEVLRREIPAHLMLRVVDGHAVACLRFTLMRDDRGKYYYINLVRTLQDYRRRGYMKELFLHLIGAVRERLQLHVVPRNEPAVRLYRSLGFQDREKPFNDRHDDILLEYISI
jgi:ribosomal protein S18 acetylase RimI-like enzyme